MCCKGLSPNFTSFLFFFNLLALSQETEIFKNRRHLLSFPKTVESCYRYLLTVLFEAQIYGFPVVAGNFDHLKLPTLRHSVLLLCYTC